MGPLEQAADGARLWVKAVPRASRSEVAGIHGDMVRIRLVVSGQARRSKVILINGITMEQVHLGLGL